MEPDVKNAKQINIFRKMIITAKKENSLFSIHNPGGVKLLTRPRLHLSHLNEHKFRHGFEDKIVLCVHTILISCKINITEKNCTSMQNIS